MANEALKAKLGGEVIDTAIAGEVTETSPAPTQERALAVVPTQADSLPVQSHVQFNREQLELLKRTLAGDANLTDDELLLYGQVCERRGVDPYSNEIHVSKRSGRLIFQTGIDAFRRKAEETGLYAGQDPPQWCGADGQWREVWADQAPPIACRVTVYRKDWGSRGLTVIAHWAEYVQKKSDGSTNSMWKQRGPAQLAKCGEALALRKAFPAKLEGLYTHDEMGQADNPIETTLSPQAVMAPALPPIKRYVLVEAFRSVISESDAAKALLKDWWKAAEIPTGKTWKETIEGCPEDRIDEVLDVIEAISNGEKPEPPDKGTAKTEGDNDGGGESQDAEPVAAEASKNGETVKGQSESTALNTESTVEDETSTAPDTDPPVKVETSPVSPALKAHPELGGKPAELLRVISRDKKIDPPVRDRIAEDLFGKAKKVGDMSNNEKLALADAIALHEPDEPSASGGDAVGKLTEAFGDVEVVDEA